jgi:hypothetical protein
LDEHVVTRYRQAGYVVAEGLFAPGEVAALRDHYMALNQAGRHGQGDGGFEPGDPLRQYPRMIHMHRWDTVSRDWLIDGRLGAALTALLGDEPYAVQTMLYFKPPGARGQALHQDQAYLRVKPGTCMAAWMALDDCDEANGCMHVVPGSHTWPVLCTRKADTAASFTDVTVPLPEGHEAVPVLMKAGDVLFFNGQLIHGSFPNTTADRFRRALIGHYIVGNARQVAEFYHPVLRMTGEEAALGASDAGGPCGRWVDVNGAPAVEMVE